MSLRLPGMPDRTLVFVNHAADAPPPRPNVDVIVLDTAWTPAPGGRHDLQALRPVMWSIIRERNVYDESLAALDDWANRAGLIGRLTVAEASWWYHIRGFLRLDLHELVLWRHVLQRVAPPGRYARIEIPRDRKLLFEAARAGGRHARPEIVRTATATTSRQFGSGRPSTTPGARTRHRIVRFANRGRRFAIRMLGPTTVRRRTLLQARLERLVATSPDVLAVVRGQSFHVMGGQEGERRADPYVSPVLEALESKGGRAAIAVLGLSHDNPDDWATLVDDERSVPLSMLTPQVAAIRAQLIRPEDLRRRLAGVQRVRLDVAGGDLGPALADTLGGLGMWFSRQQRDLAIAERLLTLLRPRVLVTGWEASRTAWLAAARRHGIPSVAIQHGVIYRNNPDYYRPVTPQLVRADLTCVFGEDERDLLIRECGYAPESVIATGSPRIAPEAAADMGTGHDWVAVREELGVADGDKVLVISAARHAVGEELHSVTIFARLLDGPLPGVHLVVKLHPEEERGDHYLALIAGLAEAGGYAPPPVTIVRDMDLYRLLRAADAHLGIYSTVLTDAVLTETPNMVAVGQAWSDLLDYAGAKVAHPVSSVDDVRAFMRRPRRPAPEAREAFLRRHFEPGDAATRIAAAVAALADQSGPAVRARVARVRRQPSPARLAWRLVRRSVTRLRSDGGGDVVAGSGPARGSVPAGTQPAHGGELGPTSKP